MTLDGPDYQIAKSRCLNCKKEIDGATPVGGGRGPQPDDVSVCAYCGHLQAYGEGLAMRELTDAEILECAGDPEILAAQEFAKGFREWKSQR
jgi:DNA-directed RNA polymerase subunit RPC12/RpoP